MAGGTLSWSEFLEQGDELLERQRRCGGAGTEEWEGWSWTFYDEASKALSSRAGASKEFCSSTRMGFAFLRTSYRRPLKSVSSKFGVATEPTSSWDIEGESGIEILVDEDEEDQLDEATLPMSASIASTATEEEASGEYVQWEYHLLYGTGYSVPVIYFNVSRLDGSLLEWEEVLAQLDVEQQALVRRIVTPKEHPLIGLLYHHIHPCETATLMKEVLHPRSSSGSRSLPYLMTWLSVVAPILALRVSLRLFLDNEQKADRSTSDGQQ